MAIRAVGFDVDGTLYKNSTMYSRSIVWAVRNLKLFNAFRDARHELRTIRPIKDFRRLQAELVAKRLGLDTSSASTLIDQKIYGEWSRVFKGIPLARGIRQTLNSLKSSGLKLAVLSDFPVDTKLADIGLDNYWELAISTENLGYLKPNPEGFKALCDGLGCSPSEVLYVGNSHRYDMIGASSLGMLTAHFANRRHKKSVADFTFADYSNLEAWILKKT